MHVHWSNMEQALRDTLVSRAEGDALKKLGELWGFEWPIEISEAAFGDALHQVAYGRRGTPLFMFDVIESALSDFNEPSVWIADASWPNRLVRDPSVPSDTRFSQRYIRIGDAVHYVQRAELNQTIGPFASATVLHIAPIDHIWCQPLDSTGAVLQNRDVILLPFLIQCTQPWRRFGNPNAEETTGDRCLWMVWVYLPEESQFPWTYLIPTDLSIPSDPPTPPNVPYGGQLVDANTQGHQIISGTDVGPHPIYLDDLPEVFASLQAQLNRLMPAAYELRLRLSPR